MHYARISDSSMYYKILISSRTATTSWWDRRFRLDSAGRSRRLVAAMPLCGAALQAADPISSGPAGHQAGFAATIISPGPSNL